MNALPAWAVAMLRGGVQAAWGLVVAWLAQHGLDLGISNELVVGLLLAAIISGTLGGLRWLETRQGPSIWAVAARGTARVLMFGLSRLQPVYAEPGVDDVRINGRKV